MNAEYPSQIAFRSTELQQDLTRIKGRLIVFDAVQNRTSLKPAFQYAFAHRTEIAPQSVTLWAHRTGRNAGHEQTREAIRRVKKDIKVAETYSEGVVTGDQKTTLQDLIEQTRIEEGIIIVEMRKLDEQLSL